MFLEKISEGDLKQCLPACPPLAARRVRLHQKLLTHHALHVLQLCFKMLHLMSALQSLRETVVQLFVAHL